MEPSPLAHSDWQYIYKRSLDDYDNDDWSVLLDQRRQYFNEQKIDQIIRLLTSQKYDPGFGYTVNNYYHSLQAATRMYQDNLSDEDIVVGLFHDVGFTVCNETHGEFAAALLRPYISDRNHWMLIRHAIFQQYHCRNLTDGIRNERDKWKDHPFYEWTIEFVDKYDQSTINHDEEILPFEFFEPIVRQVFSREPNKIACE